MLFQNHFEQQFCSISNVDNILETNIYDYEKTDVAFIEYKICNICGDDEFTIPSDDMIYCHNELFFPICLKCYANLPKPSICRKCGKSFKSRNKLFEHLRNNESHFKDPLTYEDGKIELCCEFDANLFELSKEEATKSPFYYNYKDILIQPFLYSVGCHNTKLSFKSIRESWDVEGVHDIHYETSDDIGRFVFNNNFTLFTKNNIGWVNWRGKFFIPILKIFLEL